MTAIARDVEVDSLAALEERITRAVEVVSRLRGEKDALAAQVAAAQKEAAAAHAQAQKAMQELEELRSERKQVRTRIEKLLGQMDLLSAS
ncbi:MAG: cell division protein ZapB [Bryobacteraceae bacterium]